MVRRGRIRIWLMSGVLTRFRGGVLGRQCQILPPGSSSPGQLVHRLKALRTPSRWCSPSVSGCAADSDLARDAVSPLASADRSSISSDKGLLLRSRRLPHSSPSMPTLRSLLPAGGCGALTATRRAATRCHPIRWELQSAWKACRLAAVAPEQPPSGSGLLLLFRRCAAIAREGLAGKDKGCRRSLGTLCGCCRRPNFVGDWALRRSLPVRGSSASSVSRVARWRIRRAAAAAATPPPSTPALGSLLVRGFLVATRLLCRDKRPGAAGESNLRLGSALNCLRCAFDRGTPIPSAAILSLVLPLAFALPVSVAAVPNFAGWLVGAAGRRLFQFVGLFLVFKLQKVGYIEERVALQANIDKCRLHAGQDPGDAPVVNGARQGVFIFAFVVDFRELIVFKNRKPRLMRRA